MRRLMGAYSNFADKVNRSERRKVNLLKNKREAYTSRLSRA
jgi:hypothetical protein